MMLHKSSHRQAETHHTIMQRQESTSSTVMAAQALLSLSPEEMERQRQQRLHLLQQQQRRAFVYHPEFVQSADAWAPIKVSSFAGMYEPTPFSFAEPNIVSVSESSIPHDSPYSSGSSFETFATPSPISPPLQQEHFTGSISLALPEDEEALSPLHCFMRKYCVEAFTAGPDDVTSPRTKSHAGRVIEGQVGIRCIHCINRVDKPERAVCFPSTLHNIYHSIETWQRRHSLVCPDIPKWVKASLAQLMEQSKSGAGGRRKYWEESARRLGMEDTPHGIRFIRPPGELPASICTPELSEPPGKPIVQTQDKELVTDFLFLLLDQMETCRFTEQDRAGGRSKVKDCPVDFPGLQCKHCRGKAGFGRYFPATFGALTSANSDRNMYNHLRKCRACPPATKDALEVMQQAQGNVKNKRGSRKRFFERIWKRLHA